MGYHDMTGQSLILPKKEKYTIEDVRKLIKAGYKPKVARFIVYCSALYHFKGEPGHFDSLTELSNDEIEKELL